MAADALVAEKGVSGFSLREAARKVGVDPAACYRHFQDKQAILQALARRGFTRLAGAMADALEARERHAPEQALMALARAYVGFALAHPAAFRVMFGPTGTDARDALLRGDYPEDRGAYALLQATIRTWARASRRDVDIDDASVSLWAGVHGVACLLVEGALRPADENEREHIVETLISTMIAGLGRGHARKPAPRRSGRSAR